MPHTSSTQLSASAQVDPEAAVPAPPPSATSTHAADAPAARRAIRAPDAGLQALATLSAMVPGLRWLIGLLIATLIIAGLYFGRDILIPLALAVLLGFLLDPAVSRLKRWGVPRMVATLVVVVVVLATLSGMGFYLVKQVQGLSQDLPTYQNTIKKKLDNLRALSSGPSAWEGALSTFTTLEGELSRVTISSTTGNPLAEGQVVHPVQIIPTPQKPLEMVGVWLVKVSEPIAMLGIVLLFVILILLDRDDLRDRLLRLMGGDLHVATDALDEASSRIGNYLRMQFIVNVTYGIPMAAALWWIGVPGAFLWGVVATVMRFVPYVGPMISAIFPLALAFAVAPGWDMLLWTLGLILVLELVSNNVIEPWLYGTSTGLSTLAIIMAATFWTALWGPIGLILSTPLTVCCLVLGRYLPGLKFMEVLLGSQPVLDAPQRFYQRLLADDVNGALDLAHQHIRQRLNAKASEEETAQAVADFYAQVGVPALGLASQHHTENATAEHRMHLSNGMEDVLEELLDDFPAAHEIVGGMPARVHCVGARWEVDALAADMLAHSLSLQGLASSAAGHALSAALTAEETAGWESVQWLVISTFQPQPQALLRQLQRRLRRRYPQIKLVYVLWQVAPAVLQESALQRLDAAAIATSLPEALLRMQQLVMTPEQAAQGYVPAALPLDDAQRVEFLHRSGALSEDNLPLYKEAAIKAANAFDVQYAQVSLVDSDWVHTPGSLLSVAAVEGQPPGWPRDISICSYVVRDGEALVVDDVARDPRFADNPALLQTAIKFYAGVPLVAKKGQVVGTLCIMHDTPRNLEEAEMHVLQDMAKELVKSLDLESKASKA